MSFQDKDIVRFYSGNFLPLIGKPLVVIAKIDFGEKTDRSVERFVYVLKKGTPVQRIACERFNLVRTPENLMSDDELIEAAKESAQADLDIYLFDKIQELKISPYPFDARFELTDLAPHMFRFLAVQYDMGSEIQFMSHGTLCDLLCMRLQDMKFTSRLASSVESEVIK